MDTGVRTLVTVTTAGAIAAAGALHVAWGLGSTFPFESSAELADKVVGSRRVPSPSACFGVAAVLLGSAAVVGVRPSAAADRVRRWLLRGMAATFAGRAVLGFAGQTFRVVPGSDSPSFKRIDRTRLAPLCAALAIGTVVAQGGR